MKIVGLTGQTGAGKSTVSAVFSRSGYAVIDADKVSRLIMEKGSSCLEEVVQAFGVGILKPDGTLDRKKLGDIVFRDGFSLRLLEMITYPHIMLEISKMIERYRDEGAEFILLDAPTLFEAGADKLCGCIVSVISSPEIRVERIKARDGLTEEQARNRMKSQRSEEFFVKNSDYIIENNSGVDELETAALGVIEKIAES